MESILQVFQLAMVVLPVYGFVSVRKRIYFDGLSKTRAMLRYASIVFAPIVAYTALYFLAIGAETVLDVSLVTEEISRSFLLVTALGLVVWMLATLVFAVGLFFVRKVVVSKTPSQGAAPDAE